VNLEAIFRRGAEFLLHPLYLYKDDLLRVIIVILYPYTVFTSFSVFFHCRHPFFPSRLTRPCNIVSPPKTEFAAA
jgi:hypothetical protein